MNLFLEAGKLQEQGISFALATIIESQGSTPRNTAKMVVKSDGSIIGTIGGGLAEAYIIKDSVTAIRENKSKTVEYALNSEQTNGIEMLCGGKITVFIEVISAAPRIVMIGAGHVGRAVSKLVDFLGYHLAVVDERPEFANSKNYPTAGEIYCSRDMEQVTEQLRIDGNTFIIIATDEWDLTALKGVINSEAAYIGMIGSRRKVKIVKEELQKEGMTPERLEFIHTPVGLDIGSETPEEIALSIMAEILKVRNGRTGKSLKAIEK